MAENKPNPPDQVSVALDETLDLDGIDKILEEEDPEFSQTLGDISKDKSLSIVEINLTDEESALAEEKERWANSQGLKKLIYKLVPFVPRLSLIVKKLKFRFFAFLRSIWIRLKNFGYFLATEGKNKALQKLKSGGRATKESIGSGVRSFTGLSLKLKLFLLALILFAGGAGFILFKAFTGHLVPPSKDLFLVSVEEVADQVESYDPTDLEEVEPFYDNLRAAANLILLPKMVVNLKPTPGVHPNPMAAFEFFVEGMAPEVIVTIKQNESFVRDFIQRIVETYTFPELDSDEGKRALCERIRNELNRQIEGAAVKRVYIKTVVLKP
ncbi:MAG: flagellar basal body-associated FliL family protein [Pseudobdellovibrionaceae bacterium]